MMDGNVVGQSMITYEWSDWRNGVIWWIQSVYVLPRYRKQGVFRSLFLHIENLARSNPQVKAIRLYVMSNNNTGQRTYKKLGMDDSGYIVFEKESIN
jgi:ribosomal protein S18 acetylase RimI-like enzyme